MQEKSIPALGSLLAGIKRSCIVAVIVSIIGVSHSLYNVLHQNGKRSHKLRFPVIQSCASSFEQGHKH